MAPGLGWATKFEAFAQRPVRGQAGDQDLSELAARDDSVAGVAGVAAIPLQKHELMLVWLSKAQSLQPKPIAETSTFPSLRLPHCSSSADPVTWTAWKIIKELFVS